MNKLGDCGGAGGGDGDEGRVETWLELETVLRGPCVAPASCEPAAPDSKSAVAHLCRPSTDASGSFDLDEGSDVGGVDLLW